MVFPFQRMCAHASRRIPACLQTAAYLPRNHSQRSHTSLKLWCSISPKFDVTPRQWVLDPNWLIILLSRYTESKFDLEREPANNTKYHRWCYRRVKPPQSNSSTPSKWRKERTWQSTENMFWHRNVFYQFRIFDWVANLHAVLITQNHRSLNKKETRKCKAPLFLNSKISLRATNRLDTEWFFF